MKTLTVRLPEKIAASIAMESRRRRVTKSEIVRERLQAAPPGGPGAALDGIADLIGSVEDDLPADLSARKKHYLRITGYGRNRNR